jgi:hypothetical protein
MRHSTDLPGVIQRRDLVTTAPGGLADYPAGVSGGSALGCLADHDLTVLP